MIENSINDNTRVGWLALFTSTGTLIYCALPILLVTLGFGSVVAAEQCGTEFPIQLHGRHVPL